MREINGHRPSPLKISKTSHLLQKHHQRRQPVIIYTYSPKIIHTQARDFMALVQKLTGLSPSQRPKHPSSDNNSTSADRTVNGSGAGEVLQGRSPSPLHCEPASLDNQGSHYLADIPLLTPISTGFFCSPRHVLRCPASMSPSFMEFLKELREF